VSPSIVDDACPTVVLKLNIRAEAPVLTAAHLVAIAAPTD